MSVRYLFHKNHQTGKCHRRKRRSQKHHPKLTTSILTCTGQSTYPFCFNKIRYGYPVRMFDHGTYIYIYIYIYIYMTYMKAYYNHFDMRLICFDVGNYKTSHQVVATPKHLWHQRRVIQWYNNNLMHLAANFGIFSSRLDMVRQDGTSILGLHVLYHTWTPIGSMYGIYGNIGGILMVNVTIYSIHGSYGTWNMESKNASSKKHQETHFNELLDAISGATWLGAGVELLPNKFASHILELTWWHSLPCMNKQKKHLITSVYWLYYFTTSGHNTKLLGLGFMRGCKNTSTVTSTKYRLQKKKTNIGTYWKMHFPTI